MSERQNADYPGAGEHGELFSLPGTTPSEADRVKAGMLWSAWADALGFITELTDEAGVQRRVGGRPLTEPVAWSRRVGGRQGVRAHLPEGCYSDDTQLRLATARGISPQGFDVEAFAKVELAVWPSYALGGGRASKAAAARITRASSAWFSNHFDGWYEAGGNGAAMRVQPHAWASPPSDRSYLADVLRNAVTTHGHPRALVGSVLVAVATSQAKREGRAPAVSDWPALLQSADSAFVTFAEDEHLAGYWRPAWEQAAHRSLRDAWAETIDECSVLLETVRRFVPQLADAQGLPNARRVYGELARELRLGDSDVRGSGAATTTAALAVAAAFEREPRLAAMVPALAVGTDTDTVATMAAAIVATAAPQPLPTRVLDEDYLEAEAERLAAISEGRSTLRFAYPDLLHWTGPRSALDCVGLVRGRPALAGLGTVETIEKVGGTRDAAWTWVRSSWGQTLLVKHRHELPDLAAGNWPAEREDAARRSGGLATTVRDPQSDPSVDRSRVLSAAVREAPGTAVRDADEQGRDTTRLREPVSVDAMLRWVQGRDFDYGAIGYAVRRVAELGTTDQLVAFTVALRALLAAHRS